MNYESYCRTTTPRIQDIHPEYEPKVYCEDRAGNPGAELQDIRNGPDRWCKQRVRISG